MVSKYDTKKFKYTDILQDIEHPYTDEKYKDFQEDPNIRYGFFALNDGEQRLNYIDDEKYVKIIKIIEDKNDTTHIIFEVRFKKNDGKSGTKTLISTKRIDHTIYDVNNDIVFSWDNYSMDSILPQSKLRTWFCKSHFLYTKK